MAGKGIKGITIQIGGDTVGLQKALSDVDSKARALSSEMRQVNNALKLDPTNTTLLAQKQQILAEQVKTTSDRLSQLKSVQDEVEQQYKSGAIGADAYRAYQREVVATESQLKKLEQTQQDEADAAAKAAKAAETLSNEEKDLSKKAEESADKTEDLKEEERKLAEQEQGAADKTEDLAAEEEQLSKKSEAAKGKTERFSSSLSALKTAAAATGAAITAVAKSVTAVMAAAGTGLLAAGKAATTVGQSFESAVSQIAATMGKEIEDADIQSLKAKAKELGAATQFSASQAAEGLNILAMAGLSATEQTAVVGDVLNLAAAGGLSLASAAGYTTGAMKGFGDATKPAAYYTDLMAKGATLAKTDVNGLGAALSGIAAGASSFGQEADSVTLSLLRLAQQGVTGEAAATQLNRAMADIYTPTEGAKAALKKLGIAAYDDTGKTRDFNVVVGELNAKLSQMSQEEANALKNTIFTTNGLNGFNKMCAASAEEVDKFRAGLAEASGSAEAQAKTMIDNLQGDITIMQSAAEGLGIAFYETFNDDLRATVQYATDDLSKLTEAFESGGFEAAAEAAGGMLADIAAKAAESAPQFITAVTTLVDSAASALQENAPAIASAGTQLVQSLASGFVSNTQTLLSAAVGILRSVLSELPTMLPQLLQDAGDFTSEIIGFLVRAAAATLTALPNIVTTLIDGAGSLLQTFLPKITSAVTSLIGAMGQLLPDAVSAALGALPQLLKTVTKTITESVPQLIATLTVILPDVLAGVGESLITLLPVILETIVSLVDGIAEALPDMVTSIVSMLPQAISTILTVVLGSLPMLIGAATRIVNSLAEALPDMIVSIIAVLPDLISSVLTALLTNLPQIVQAGLTLFTALVKALPQIITTIVAALPDIIVAVLAALDDATPLLIECGLELFVSLIEALPDIIIGIVEAVPQIIEALVKAFKESAPKMVESGKRLMTYLVEELPKTVTRLGFRLAETVNGIVSGISSAVTGKISELWSIGSNLVAGLWEGIQGAKDWLIDNIFSWCSTITDSIKDFFGIHSPSTLFRDDIGENLALGVGEGFAGSMKDVSRQMQAALPTAFDIDPSVNITTDRFRVYQPQMATQPAAASASYGGINFTLHIDNFNNSYGSSMSELADAFGAAAYDYVRRMMLVR